MNKNLKTILAVIVALITLIGGIWAFNNTFATNIRVDKEITTLEIEVAGALQNQQIKSDYQFYQFMYDKYTQDMNEIKRQLRREPTNTLLRQEYQDVKNERSKVKQKLDEMIRKIN